MRVRIHVAACAAAAVLAAPVWAQTVDDRAAARDIVTKRGDAVVVVRATVKVRASRGSQQLDPLEDTITANAVVLDGTGLAVTALSQLDPSDMLKRMLSAPGGPAMEMSVEQSEIRFRLANGTEVPAKIVLRDRDLDLAFLRPTAAPASPMISVDMTMPGKVQMADMVIVLQRFGEMTGWKPGVSFGSVQAVVEKPRTLYVVAATSVGGGGLGSAVFDTTGKFLGLIVMRSMSSRPSMLSMMQGSEGAGLLPVVLPVEEIAELAKQAK
ncbi:MAG: serine protease [Acidobacteriota bacterium]|nr:serine protease [Acidobacteriota bacterium]